MYRKRGGCHAAPEWKPTGSIAYIYDGVHIVRTNVEHVYHNAETYLHQFDDFYQTGKEHSRGNVDDLRRLMNDCDLILCLFSCLRAQCSSTT